MDIIERIIKTENEFPKMFASYVEKEWGILFYDLNNKTSHDSNHAILHDDKISNIEAVLEEIKEFYLNKKIIPRIYQPFKIGYFENCKDVLSKLGFDLKLFGNNQYMLLKEKNTIIANNRLTIKRIFEWDIKIAADIYIPNEEEYEINVLKESIKHNNFYLFVGYLNNIAVTNISFHTSEYNCTRFDYISTSKEYRKNNFAREIISYAINYCNSNNIGNCYQWPAHITSEKLCYEGGFRKLFEIQAAEVCIE